MEQSCESTFFQDKKVIYWQRGGGPYALLPHTICGALGLHIFGITKFIYRQCGGSYPPMPLPLQSCRSTFLGDKKVIYWQRGGRSYASLPHTICGAPSPHFFRIIKFIYGECGGSYPPVPLHLLSCGSAFFRNRSGGHQEKAT